MYMIGIKKGKKMGAFECYQTYVALKLHFNSDRYDYFKSEGKTRISINSFEKRNDKYFFEKLSTKYSSKRVEEFLVANLVADGGLWIGEAFNDQAVNIYHEWKKRVQALTYNFKEEITKLPTGEKFDGLFAIKPNEHPPLLRLVLQKEISIETFIILNEILSFFPHWNAKLKDDVVWQDVRKRAKKYKKFIVDKLDIKEFKKLLKTQILDKTFEVSP
jgi:hypothetical protein